MNREENSCAPRGVRTHGIISRWFPVPRIISTHAAGVDISDTSIKILSLKHARQGLEIDARAEVRIESGIVEDGVVRNVEALADALKGVSEEAGVKSVHIALPEEQAYVFEMHAPDVSDHKKVLTVIEFELEGRVPLTIEQAVYDYDIIEGSSDGVGARIGVSVFPKTIVHGYTEAARLSGLRLESLEIEARSIGRAIIPERSAGVILVADFGRARTGIAILKSGVPIFTSTVSVGGSTMTDALVEKFNISADEARQIKNEYGILAGEKPQATEVMLGTASALADEIARHYRYWDEKRSDGEGRTAIDSVLMCGGNSNLKGLPSYIARRVQASAKKANVWENVCSFDDYIPPIDAHNALGYATAIGLALRGV